MARTGPARQPEIVWLSEQKPSPPSAAAPHVTWSRSAYEAAARILKCQVAALVVHLPALARRHLRLLEIARASGLAMFGYGPVGSQLRSGDLDGVLLVSEDTLGERLCEAVRLARPAEPPEQIDFASSGPGTNQPKTETTDQPQAQSEAQPRAQEQPKHVRQEAPEDPPPEDWSQQQPSQRPAAQRSPTSAAQADPPPSPSAMLTAEELAALLEHEQ